jgi:hypothetical protein
MIEPNKSFSAHTKLAKDRLIEAEEQGSIFSNRMTAHNPLDKYTEATFPLIHYAHLTTIFDHLDINQVGEWENLLKGKILAQPFGPDAQSIGKHPHLKTLLFAIIVEITNSHNVSVCAPQPKTNLYRTLFSFLIYNISDKHA